MSTYDPERIQEIKQRLAAATPGPWEAKGDGHEWDWRVSVPDDALGGCPDCGVAPEFDRGDATLIANAPADLAYLLDLLEGAQTWYVPAWRADNGNVCPVFGEHETVRREYAERDAKALRDPLVFVASRPVLPWREVDQ